MDPARVIEDVVPVMINYQDFFVSGSLWQRYHERNPDCQFFDFWFWKLRRYDIRNCSTRHFFESFCRDPVEHHRILNDRIIHRELNLMNMGLFVAPAGLLEPKPEPVEDGEIGPLEYSFRRLCSSSLGKEIAIVEDSAEDLTDFVEYLSSKQITSRFAARFIEVLTNYVRDIVNVYSEDNQVMSFEEFVGFVDVILDNTVDVILEEMSEVVARDLYAM